MAQVGVANEPLLERALYVFDGAIWRPLLSDTFGRVVIATDIGTPILATVSPAGGANWTVVQATPANLQAAVNLNADQNVQARAYGYIGGAWQRQPLQFGYSDTVADTYSNLSLPAGTTTVNFTAVPASTVHVITNLQAWYSGTITNVFLTYQLVIDGTARTLWGQKAPVSGQHYDRQGNWVLGPGDNVRFIVDGATLNDDLVVNIHGYAVTINL